MSSDIAISVRNLTKTYRIFGHPGDRIKQALTLGRVPFHREFTALKDVSFDIKKGETVGIIGRNGSGKSTLLQLLCGILKPSSGSVTVNGRVSALLELGAGFNPEFTGRENVYFQGALMGFTKRQMDERFDDIAAFADIGEFIDQPVRMYSSGMFVRLAFAVAIHMEPEILVVDEALGVGDFAFQRKCFQRINSIREGGGAVLLVTHAVEQVAHFCDRALLLSEGVLISGGATSTVLAHYVKAMTAAGGEAAITTAPKVSNTDARLENRSAYNPDETRWGDRAATIIDAFLVQNGREGLDTLAPGLTAELRLNINFHAQIEKPIYGLTIKSSDGAPLFRTNSRELLGPSGVPAQKAGDDLCICFEFLPFLDAGDYLISVGVASDTPQGIVPHDRRYDSIWLRIASPRASTGDIEMKPTFRMLD
ncbi:MAG: ABC transporter ATP-binding protein [Gammaproteobacteria bacterium]